MFEANLNLVYLKIAKIIIIFFFFLQHRTISLHHTRLPILE